PRAAHFLRVRAAGRADDRSRPPAQPAGAAPRDLGRQRIPRSAGNRRAHPSPAREARARARQAPPHPHGERRGVPPARGLAMRARPRLPAFGLRSRIVGAVLGTAVATLVVAAIALLGPLENSLRNAAMKTLQADLHG